MINFKCYNYYETNSRFEYLRSNLFIDKDANNISHIRLRSGKNIVPNSNGQEEWFEISFMQIGNGKILAYFKQHGQNKHSENLMLIEDVAAITADTIFDILYSGLEEATKNSFLFIAN